MVTGRALRLTRGLSVAAAGVALPLVGHLSAGGAATISAMTLLVFGFVAAVTVMVSTREWTVLRLVATLVPTQALVHLTLTSGAGHGGAHAVAGASSTPATPPMAVDGTDSAMLLGHLAALGAVVLWLRMAERALLWFVALVRRLFVRVELLGVARLVDPRYAASAGLVLPLLLVRSQDSRGPPHLSFA